MDTLGTLRVDPSNAATAKAWDGDEGAYWAVNAERFDRVLANYHRRFMDAAQIRLTDHVLDIGCGTGQTTRDAARAAADGDALGIDLSSEMIAVARRLAQVDGLRNARFRQADAQIHAFDSITFDAAISRTGAMFFGRPEVAFTNIAGALRAGGRLVLLTWMPVADNEWIREISTAAAAGRDLPAPAEGPGPFSLSNSDRIRDLLHSTGFVATSVEPVSEAVWFGDDADDATSFTVGLVGWMLDGLDDSRRRRAIDSLHAGMAAHQTPAGVLYGSGMWLTVAHRG
jgi:SAM-dependent methyltransferase